MLRPSSTSAPNSFTVVGKCYLHHHDDAVALLGPLPPGWKVQVLVDSESYSAPRYRNMQTGKLFVDDPRLPPLRAPWTRADYYALENRGVNHSIFVNEMTGEKTFHDPRMSANELRKRGVKLRNFDLH